MRQLIVIIVLIFSFTEKEYAQTDSVYTGTRGSSSKAPKAKKNQDWKKKMTYGGNFQAYYTGIRAYVYLSPTIGYIPFKNANIGVGVIYNYTSADYGQYGKFSESIFGGHSFARYFVLPSVFIQGQFDKLRQTDWYSANDNKVWVDYLMVGGGYSQPLGQKLAFNISLMYNLTYQRLSIYNSPFVFQLGFTGRF